MKKKYSFSKHHKILLALGGAAIVSAATITPLSTSCSVNNQINDIGDFDKTYHVNKVMYDNLENKAMHEYRAKLMTQYQQHKITYEEVGKALNKAQEKVNLIRENNEKNKVSYTVSTESLIESFNDYGVKLSRDFSETSINWTKLQTEFYESVRNTYRKALTARQVETHEIEAMVEGFNKRFNSLCQDLNKSFDDPLTKLNKLKGQIFTCLDDMNDEASYLNSNTKLKDFFKEFSINYNPDNRPQNSEPLYWDTLKCSVGDDLTDLIQNNFECYSKTDKKATTNFRLQDLVSNFHVSPVFKGFDCDPKTNKYWINVDWTFMSNDSYARSQKHPEDKVKLTAHSARLKDEKKHADRLSNSKNYAVDFDAVPDADKDFTRVYLPVTDLYEAKVLRTTYLDKLEFRWDETDNCSYDSLFDYSATIGPQGGVIATHGWLTQDKLGAAGLTVIDWTARDNTPIRLSKILADLSKKTSSDDELPNNLAYEFFKNCELKTDTLIVDDARHKVSNVGFAKYKNKSSPLASGGWIRLIPIDKDPPFQKSLACQGFPISKKFYESCKQSFMKAKDWRDNFQNLDKYNAFNKALGIITAIVSIVGVILSLVIANFFFKCFWAFRLDLVPSLVCALVALALSVGWMVFWGWFNDKIQASFNKCMEVFTKPKPTDTPQRKRKYEVWTKFSNLVDHDWKNIFCDYEVFKKHAYVDMVLKKQDWEQLKYSKLFKELEQICESGYFNSTFWLEIAVEIVGVLVLGVVMNVAACLIWRKIGVAKFDAVADAANGIVLSTWQSVLYFLTSAVLPLALLFWQMWSSFAEDKSSD